MQEFKHYWLELFNSARHGRLPSEGADAWKLTTKFFGPPNPFMTSLTTRNPIPAELNASTALHLAYLLQDFVSLDDPVFSARKHNIRIPLSVHGATSYLCTYVGGPDVPFPSYASRPYMDYNTLEIHRKHIASPLP